MGSVFGVFVARLVDMCFTDLIFSIFLDTVELDRGQRAGGSRLMVHQGMRCTLRIFWRAR